MNRSKHNMICSKHNINHSKHNTICSKHNMNHCKHNIICSICGTLFSSRNPFTGPSE